MGLVGGFNKRVEVKLPTWKGHHVVRKTGAKVKRCKRKSLEYLGANEDEAGKANHGFVAIEVTLDSAIRKDETLPFEATWVDLENMMLSEVRQKKSRTI